VSGAGLSERSVPIFQVLPNCARKSAAALILSSTAPLDGSLAFAFDLADIR
jgi:hypothetical protein